MISLWWRSCAVFKYVELQVFCTFGGRNRVSRCGSPASHDFFDYNQLLTTDRSRLHENEEVRGDLVFSSKLFYLSLDNKCHEVEPIRGCVLDSMQYFSSSRGNHKTTEYLFFNLFWWWKTASYTCQQLAVDGLFFGWVRAISNAVYLDKKKLKPLAVV